MSPYRLLIVLLIGFGAVPLAGPVALAAEAVRFTAAGVQPSPLKRRMQRMLGEEAKPSPGIALRGRLFRPPTGPGPNPGLVLLHGCFGITPAIEDWAARFADWGYATLLVDSYGPRRHRPSCLRYDDLETIDQTFDGLGALQYLAGRPDVDGGRVGLVGWSVGGSKVLAALNRIGVHNLYAEKFRLGVAFYPYCLAASGPFIGPLLLLAGADDDWTPPRHCRRLAARNADSDHPPDLRVYPAAHFFDDPDVGPARLRPEIENREKTPSRGVTWGYSAAADEAARADVRAFLRRWLPP
ncbi:MAG: dienelactone hydrolase family protein [Alphaproteobacteria bacterium]|jgi:dienelactone hydrolase|nr:dienelactone hydrolase family protein [Alphaproteobacteria bacterium]MDP6564206.1 dienelactone hydrolase family protein [Alphaproteobacteria bacterium]MDP6814442.1 dienelactone hydrolase family protein [Alphaproteobacteria bacterium]